MKTLTCLKMNKSQDLHCWCCQQQHYTTRVYIDGKELLGFEYTDAFARIHICYIIAGLIWTYPEFLQRGCRGNKPFHILAYECYGMTILGELPIPAVNEVHGML